MSYIDDIDDIEQLNAIKNYLFEKEIRKSVGKRRGSFVKRPTIIRVEIDEGAYYPVHAHEDDAGYDLKCKEDIIVPAKGSVIVDTGIHFEIPRKWFGKLESKSGLNVMNAVFCAGGVIDSGFTGPIKCRVYNFSDKDYEFKAGDKVVQIVFLPIATPTFKVGFTRKDYERGESGYGSSGK